MSSPSPNQPLNPEAAAEVAARLRAHLEWAEAEINAGRYETARQAFVLADREMLTLPVSYDERPSLRAYSYLLQGMIYYHTDQMAQARQELEAARQELSWQAEDDGLLALILNTLGNIDYLQGQHRQATIYYEQAIAAALRVDAHRTAATALSNLGNIQVDAGHVEAAIALYERSLGQAEDAGQEVAAAVTYRAIALLYAEHGPVSLALEYADKAMALISQIDDEARLLTVLCDSGHVYLIAGNVEQAEDCFHTAFDLAQRREGKFGLDGVLVGLADINRVKGDNRAWYSNAIQAFNYPSGTVYWKEAAAHLLALYYLNRPDWPKARKYINWLKENLNDRSLWWEISWLARLEGLLYGLNAQWDEADVCFERAVANVNANMYKYRLAEIYHDHGATLVRRGLAEQSNEATGRAADKLTQALDIYQQVGLSTKAAEVSTLLDSL